MIKNTINNQFNVLTGLFDRINVGIYLIHNSSISQLTQSTLPKNIFNFYHYSFLQKVNIMGQCISKNNNSIKQPIFQPNPPPKEEAYGIQILQSNQSCIKFSHSPLTHCDFLSDKFSKNSSAPQQVNLTFMLLNAVIDPVENLVNLSIINQNQINIYLALGGSELINNTGLTVEIGKIKYVEKINRATASPLKGEEITVVPAKMSGQPIFIILEPVLKHSQTMFLITRYIYSEADKIYKRKSQTMQWSSLAFDLQDIYGADNLFKCDNGEQCSVCLSNPANVILAPCRHMCLCFDCSKSYEKLSKRCPICRAEFRSTIGYK